MKSFVSLLREITYHILDVGIFINKTINIKLPVRASFPVVLCVQVSWSGIWIFCQRKPESKLNRMVVISSPLVFPREVIPKIQNHTISITVVGDPSESQILIGAVSEDGKNVST